MSFFGIFFSFSVSGFGGCVVLIQLLRVKNLTPLGYACELLIQIVLLDKLNRAHLKIESSGCEKRSAQSW